jgi:hypothetical protein
MVAPEGALTGEGAAEQEGSAADPVAVLSPAGQEVDVVEEEIGN